MTSHTSEKPKSHRARAAAAAAAAAAIRLCPWAMLDADETAALAMEVAAAQRDILIDPAVLRCGASAGIQNEGYEYFNERLGAPNVWEVDVEFDVVQEAAALFNGARLRHAHESMAGKRGAAVQSFSGGGASFALVQPKGWSSDVNWFSADDEATMARFGSIFDRLGLASLFAPVVGHEHTLRMFSALFVVRTECTSANVHSDWTDAVGTNALTLITPLTECAADQNGGFQLLYEGRSHAAGGGESGKHLQQYTYTCGKAIVFGAGFRHSTEPGRAASASEPQAFLCLTFGTDKLEMWPAIANKGLRDQSRLLTRPDGSLEKTGLGVHVADNSLSFIRQAMAAM